MEQQTQNNAQLKTTMKQQKIIKFNPNTYIKTKNYYQNTQKELNKFVKTGKLSMVCLFLSLIPQTLI